MENDIREFEPSARRIGSFGSARLAAEIAGDTGQRPPLVLLHGLTFDRTMWQPVIEELHRRDPGRHVLALDLPGHGDSPEQPSYTLDDVAEFVSLAVEDAGLAPPVLVGHSIAALIATIYATRYPTCGIVNVDQSLRTTDFLRMLQARASEVTGPGFPGLWKGLLGSMHIELLPDAAQQLVRSTSRPRQHVVVGYWREALEQPVEHVEQKMIETLAILRRNELPYLIVAGAEPSRTYAEWLAGTLPQATLTVLPRGGHFPHLSDPDKFAGCLATTGVWSRAQSGLGMRP